LTHGTGAAGARAPEVRLRRTLEWLARAIVPPTTPQADALPDDYRRAVVLIALLAVGFFVPSLPLAGVPQDRWPVFIGLTAIAGVVLSGSFILVRRGSPWLYPWVAANATILAVLGRSFTPYYHELDLAFALIVAGHAIVHGFGAALVMAALGSLVVPFAIDGGPANATDPVYAAIYLLGVALIPWVAERLAGRRLIEVRRNLQAVTEIEREAVHVLARAAEAKDDVTGNHVLRVGEVSARLAIATGASRGFVDDLRFAAMLQDVGKLHVPDAILMKPGRLDPDEWETVRRHTIWGERILGSTDGFSLARQVARSHHENWDGTGYPDGLVGAHVPLAARIVHLADVFDALQARRPYKSAWPLERCLEEIERQAGRMFDPDLSRDFLTLIQTGLMSDVLDVDVRSEPLFQASAAPLSTGSLPAPLAAD
jgi:putative two-component system response regulator